MSLASSIHTAAARDTGFLSRALGRLKSALAVLRRDQKPTAPGVSIEERFEILRNERRRMTIMVLDSIDDDSIPLSDLAELVAERENGEEYDYGERKAMYTSLYQSHLSKLDEAGIVDYDQHLVHVGPNHDVFVDLIDYVTPESEPQSDPPAEPEPDSEGEVEVETEAEVEEVAA